MLSVNDNVKLLLCSFLQLPITFPHLDPYNLLNTLFCQACQYISSYVKLPLVGCAISSKGKVFPVCALRHLEG